MNNIYLGFWEILALDAPPWSRAGTGEAIFMYQLLVLESGLWSISFQWRKEWKFLRPTLNGVNFSQHPHSSAKRVELVRSIFSQVDKSLPDDGLHLKCCAQILRRPKPTYHSTSWPFFQKSHSPNLPLLYSSSLQFSTHHVKVLFWQKESADTRVDTLFQPPEAHNLMMTTVGDL